MKRAVLYARVSTQDQHPETQLLDLRAYAQQRGYEIVQEYVDVISGSKSKRPGSMRCWPMLGDANLTLWSLPLSTGWREAFAIFWKCWMS